MPRDGEIHGNVGPSGSVKTGVADSKDEQILSQITEEMRSMRNHFIVVTLLEMRKGHCRAVINDPVCLWPELVVLLFPKIAPRDLFLTARVRDLRLGAFDLQRIRRYAFRLPGAVPNVSLAIRRVTQRTAFDTHASLSPARHAQGSSCEAVYIAHQVCISNIKRSSFPNASAGMLGNGVGPQDFSSDSFPTAGGIVANFEDRDSHA